jgi:hypothetical protein
MANRLICFSTSKNFLDPLGGLSGDRNRTVLYATLSANLTRLSAKSSVILTQQKFKKNFDKKSKKALLALTLKKYYSLG